MKALKRAASRLLTEVYSLGKDSPPPGLRILMYHAVGTRLDFDNLGLSIDPGLFEEQMRFLKKDSGLELTPLVPECLAAAPRPRIAVTFDDGYRDNLQTAAPVLARLGIPFTVFAVPSYIRSGNPYYLDLSMLKELSAIGGCSIGSHGLNHLPLARLPAPQAHVELSESRRQLEDMLGRPVTTLSYPYGSANPEVRQAAAAAGYRLAACSRTGVNAPQRDPLMLCRTEILAYDGLRTFRQKLRGGWDWHGFRHKDPSSGFGPTRT